MIACVHSRLALRTLRRLRSCAEGLTARFFPTGLVPQENHNFIPRRHHATNQSSAVPSSVLLRHGDAGPSTGSEAGPRTRKAAFLGGPLDVRRPKPVRRAGRWRQVHRRVHRQMILGGFFLQARWKEQGALGEMRSLEVVGYDPVNKNIFSSGFQDDGSTWSGKVSLSGSTLTFTGKVLSAGKQYPIRATYILAPDLASATRKEEISVDGKSWTTTSQSKWTKVKPAAKK